MVGEATPRAWACWRSHSPGRDPPSPQPKELRVDSARAAAEGRDPAPKEAEAEADVDADADVGQRPSQCAPCDMASASEDELLSVGSETPPPSDSCLACDLKFSIDNILKPDFGKKAPAEAPTLLWPAWVYCTRYSDRPSSGKWRSGCRRSAAAPLRAPSAGKPAAPARTGPAFMWRRSTLFAQCFNSKIIAKADTLGIM